MIGNFELPSAEIAVSGEEIAEVVRPLSGARVLITGATGFIGQWLIAGLLASKIPIELVLLGRDSQRIHNMVSSKFNSQVTIYSGDLLILESLKNLPTCTHVIHAASGTRRDGIPLHELADLDDADLGMVNLLRACENMPLKKIVMISSGIAGNVPSLKSTGVGYAIGKRVAETRLCLSAGARGFSAVIARVWSLIGPGLPTNRGYAAADFIAAAASGSGIKIHGDGSALRSYQYPTDTVLWLWSLLVRGEEGTIYDVGGEESITIWELAKLIERLSGCPAAHMDGNPLPTSVYVPDLSLAQSLGLTNKVRLSMALERSLRWARRERKS